VGHPATDAETPSGAALAVALGRGSEGGLLAAYDTYGPDMFDYARFLLTGHPDGRDEAAGAVLDALLVATGAVGDLTEPERMLAWLLALTRNECLRRGADATTEDEAAELGRRGLGRVEVAALLGFAPAALPRRVPPEHLPPDWLRVDLLAAAGPEAVALRAELTRRARPFEPDGFPIPLDRRRLSGKVLAWAAAAAVVVALGLLVVLPSSGNAGSSAASPAAVAAAATTGAAAGPARVGEDPVPTLGQARLGSAGGGSASVGPPSTAASAGPRSPAPAAASSPRPQPGPTGRQSPTTASIEVSWSAVPGSCGRTWSAHLRATTGGVQVSGVTAMVSRTGATVALHPDGAGWSADLTGLPTNGVITVSVSADGAAGAGSARLRADC
jgi:DNA-directed RNA polymerase specialized sigma24 family protein